MATTLPPTERPLDYARPTLGVIRSIHPELALYVAMTCGLLPICSGTAAIVGWLTTRSGSFQVLGLLTILGGCVLFLFGGAALLAYAWRLWTTFDRLPKGPAIAAACAAFILLANFPVCAWYLSLSERALIRVVNASNAHVRSIVVTDPRGRSWDLGPLAPGERTRRLLPLGGEGVVRFSAGVNGSVARGDVDPYISGNCPDHTITINPTGVTVR
jgi:hypothetical protein